MPVLATTLRENPVVNDIARSVLDAIRKQVGAGIPWRVHNVTMGFASDGGFFTSFWQEFPALLVIPSSRKK